VRLAPPATAGVPVVAMPRLGTRRTLGLLLLLAVAAVLLQGTGTPHTHAVWKPGFYNQDHDLVLLATLHSAAVLVDAPPAPFVFVLVAAIALLAIRPPASAARATCDSRAPPRA
jgi:hypothetical protein